MTVLNHLLRSLALCADHTGEITHTGHHWNAVHLPLATKRAARG
jgi:hypothetical protein